MMEQAECSICAKFAGLDQIIVYEDKKICLSCLGRLGRIAKSFSKATNLLNEEKVTEKPEDLTVWSPQVIKEKLDKHVVGQERAKKVLSVAAYEHYKRSKLNDNSICKSNILLIGPTGCGKTYLVQTLAKILDRPLAICSATNLTETGWKGEDVSSVVSALYKASGQDKDKTERGIIFVDEIDKLGTASSRSKMEIGGKGVQQALLPILEGTKVTVTKTSRQDEDERVEIDTTHILFICGGAFPELENIISKRMGRKTQIGFMAREEEDSELPSENLLMNTTNEDLKEFGFIPEFIGRLPIVTFLKELTLDDLRRVCIEPENSVINQYKKLLAFDGIDLEIDDSALSVVAEKARAEGTGARGLRKTLEELLLDIRYNLPGSGASKVIISRGATGELQTTVKRKRVKRVVEEAV